MDFPPIRMDIGNKLFKTCFIICQKQSPTSLRTASLLVSDAIRGLLNILFTMLSNVGV